MSKPMWSRPLHIACYGELADGFTFVGPFHGRRCNWRRPDAWLPLENRDFLELAQGEPRFIVISGSVVEGLSASGPFTSTEDAEAHGGLVGDDWVVAELSNVAAANVVQAVLDLGLGKEAA